MTSDTTDFDGCDVERSKDQGTQTTEGIVRNIVSVTTSPRLPLPRDIKGSAEESITLFEFCQVLQDPDCPQSVTIIKETATEENKFHPKDIDNPSDRAVSNRYKYCKEVIRPYLKYSNECPESDEKLLKDALDVVSEDFPDYQPCAQPDTEDENTNENTSKTTTSSADKIDAGTSTDMDKDPNDNKPEAFIIIKTECGTCPSVVEVPVCVPSPPVCPQQKPQCPPPASACTPNESACPSRSDSPSSSSPRPCSPKQTNPCCPPIDIKKCKKKMKDEKEAEENKKPCTPKPKPKPKPNCCDTEPTIGVCPKPCGHEDEKPKYILRKRCKDSDSPISINVSGICITQEEIDKIKESHIKTVCTIKTAMEDFMGKVAESGKEAISMITNESSKQLEKLKGSDKPDKPKKCCDHDCKAALTSRFFQRAEDNDRAEHGIGIRDEFPKLAEAVDTIVATVDSTMSTITDRLSESFDSLPERFQPSKSNDKGAPLDKPPTPKDVSHTHLFLPDSGAASNPSGIFSAIKSRICSIFGNEPVIERPIMSISRTSSNSLSRSSKH